MSLNRIVTDSAQFKAGVELLRDLVGMTMGPFGSNVMPVGHNKQSEVFRDGARVVDAYRPYDAIEHTAVQRLRDAAIGTMLAAGDGTSTTTVFLSTLYLTALEKIEALEAENKPVMRRIVAEKVVELISNMRTRLTDMTIKDISDDLLAKVATIAAANNPVIGKKVAELIREVGPKSTIEEGITRGAELETSVIPGYTLDAGVYHRSFLPQNSSDLRIENPYIVLVNDSVLTSDNLAHFMKPYNAVCKKDGMLYPIVFVVTDLGGVALTTFLARQAVDMNGNPVPGMQVPMFAVHAPKEETGQAFEDLAAISGATVIGKNNGVLLNSFDFHKHTGKVTSITISMSRCTIVRPDLKMGAQRAYDGLLERLEALIAAAEDADSAAAITARLSNLKGKVGVVKIPASTQGDASWRFEVVNDAWRAAQSALLHGALPGCGRALMESFSLVVNTDGLSSYSVEERIAIVSLNAACESVIRFVLANAGVGTEDADWIIHDLSHADPQFTLVIDDLFISERQKTDNRTAAKARTLDATEAGVLDSAHAIQNVLLHSAAEFPLWIQTTRWVSE